MQVLVNGEPCTVRENEVCRYVVRSLRERADRVQVAVIPETAVDGAQIKPLSAGIACRLSEGRICFETAVPAKLSLEFPDGALPLFLFLYQPEEQPAGEQVRYFAPGEYRAERLELHSGDTLYLAEGAVLHAPVGAVDAENITVCGRGILDVDECGDRARRLFHFIRSRKLTVRDITMTGSRGWCCVFTGCENVTVDGVNIISWRCTGDGVDIVGSHDVTVQGCFLRTADDCVAIKAAGYADPAGMQNVYNIAVRHCVMWNAQPGNGMEIGFETRCDEIHHVVFEDIDLIHCEHEGWQSGGSMTIHNGDRARIHDIVYRNIRIEDSHDKLFDFKVMKSNYSRDDIRGCIEDVTVERVAIVSGAFPPSILMGYMPEDSLVRRVRFSDITAYGQPIRSVPECRMICERTKEITFEKGNNE